MGGYYQLPEDKVNCMENNRKRYMFSAKNRLTSTTGNSSLCSQGLAQGDNCIQVSLASFDIYVDHKFKLVYDMTESEGITHPDDTWYSISSVFDLTKQGSSTVNGSYPTLLFSGPEHGIDISIDDMLISRVMPDYFPDPQKICSNMAYMNGDAERSSVFAYPVQTNNIKGSLLTIRKETTANGTVNRYFHMSGRKRDFSSPLIYLESKCLTKYGMYRFAANLRIFNGNQYTKACMVMKVWYKDETVYPPFEVRPVAFCMPTTLVHKRSVFNQRPAALRKKT